MSTNDILAELSAWKKRALKAEAMLEQARKYLPSGWEWDDETINMVPAEPRKAGSDNVR